VSEWFDNIVSIRSDWATERGARVEASDYRMPCYVQDTCTFSVMSQVLTSDMY